MDERRRTSARNRPYLPGLRDPVSPRPDRGLLPLLRPARPGVRPGRAAPHRDPRVDRGGAAVALALCAPAAGRASHGAAPAGRLDAARPRAAARGGARARRALAQAGHGEPDALVQGPRRRRRHREGRRVRADDDRLLLHGQSRERRRRARRSGGARRRRALPGGSRAGEADRNGDLRGADLRGRRELRRLQPADDRALVRARLGVRERRPALVLRRGLEDAGLRDRRAARLDVPRRGGRADRVGRDVLEGAPGLQRAA